jgi:hypothetical protein
MNAYNRRTIVRTCLCPDSSAITEDDSRDLGEWNEDLRFAGLTASGSHRTPFTPVKKPVPTDTA